MGALHSTSPTPSFKSLFSHNTSEDNDDKEYVQRKDQNHHQINNRTVHQPFIQNHLLGVQVLKQVPALMYILTMTVMTLDPLKMIQNNHRCTQFRQQNHPTAIQYGGSSKDSV